MIYKNTNITASVDANADVVKRTSINFSTQDVGTAKLNFNLFKDGVPLPLSAVKGTLVLLMADGSRFQRDIKITDKINGKAEYVLSNDEIKHYGDVRAELALYYDNKQSLAVIKFNFAISKSLIDTDIAPTAEYYIQTFEDLKEDIETIVADLQEKFKDLNNVETKEGAQQKADAVQANLDTHTSNKSNPHNVTKAQVGLGSVDNVQQAAKADFDLHVSDGVRHITTSERSKWNGSQMSKLTQDNGLIKNLSGTDFNTVIESGFYYMTSASTTLNAPVNSNGYLLVYNYGTYPYQEFTSYSGVTSSIPDNRRKFIRNKVSGTENWTPWMEIEYAAGAQAKVDTHANRTDNPHSVTKAQVGLDKVDNVQQASLAEFNAHNYNSVRHVVQADKDKWNGSQIYKLTADEGHHLIGLSGKDLFTELASKKTTTFYSNNTTTNQPPVSSSFRGIQIGQDNIGEVLAMGNDGSTWRITNANGWKTWKRLFTNEDFESITWQNVTLKNGAATGERIFQYVKWGNLLLLRGHITASREVVCGTIPSDRLPANGAVAMVPVSGTTGYSKLLIYANGDMKLTGIHSNNDSAVSGYYMDVVVPLN
ncbi:BppU family phage baseplate upper protein [Bacillus subtilis]|uniref:BppU family phage baseplate upper protein n=1 Tax=Bacillus subtilis TaxID=1423 RepID=UPI00240CEA3D|nr:BppU family phage baseplate upper protein [Bacillus subtilis]WEZ22043.1 BppU family phage baseplate upper protein [Bacillus subtilis]